VSKRFGCFCYRFASRTFLSDPHWPVTSLVVQKFFKKYYF
jgi:hypothetical protein